MTWGWRIEGTSDATEIVLASLGSAAVRTPVVGHCVDASFPLVNWSFDSELDFSSLRSFAKREEAEVAGTCFVVAVCFVAAVAAVVCFVVAAVVVEVFSATVVAD